MNKTLVLATALALPACSGEPTVLALESGGLTLELASSGFAVTQPSAAFVDLGDIDGDRNSDFALIAHTPTSEQIQLYYGSAARTGAFALTPDATLEFPGQVDFVRIAKLGDVDGDGKGDVGISLPSVLVQGDDDATVLLGRAHLLYGGPRLAGVVAGASVVVTTVDQTALLSIVEVGDLDGDGRAELGMRRFNDDEGSFELFYGAAQRTTLASPDARIIGGIPEARRLGDFDGDGRDDLGITAGWWPDPFGHFPSAVQPIHAVWGTAARLAGTIQVADLPKLAPASEAIVAVGDLDFDGRDDLVYPGTSLLSIVRGGSRPDGTTPLAGLVTTRIGTAQALAGAPLVEEFWIEEPSFIADDQPSLVFRARGPARSSLLTARATALAGDIEVDALSEVVGTPYQTTCEDPEGDGTAEPTPCTGREFVDALAIGDADGDGHREVHVVGTALRGSRSGPAWRRIYALDR